MLSTYRGTGPSARWAPNQAPPPLWAGSGILLGLRFTDTSRGLGLCSRKRGLSRGHGHRGAGPGAKSEGGSQPPQARRPLRSWWELWGKSSPVSSPSFTHSANVYLTIRHSCRHMDSFVGRGREGGWNRKQQPTPALSPGKFNGQRSLVGYSPWGPNSRTRLSTSVHARTHTLEGGRQTVITEHNK